MEDHPDVKTQLLPTPPWLPLLPLWQGKQRLKQAALDLTPAEGLEHLSYVEKLSEPGQFSLEKKWLLSMGINTYSEVAKRMKPGSCK